MSNQYTSYPHELLHFVGSTEPENDELNYETLLKVLSTSCISHPPHEVGWSKTRHTVNWDESLKSEKLIVPEITCYADIPPEALEIHISKYGKFGLGLDANYLIKYGTRPVSYIPMRGDDWAGVHGQTLLDDIEATMKGFRKHLVDKFSGPEKGFARPLGIIPKDMAEAISALDSILMKDFLAYIKPFNSELSAEKKENYYMEREWRKYGNLMFEDNHVTKVFIEKGYENKLLDQYPQFKNILVLI